MSTLHPEAQISVASNSQSPFELIKKTNSAGFEIWSARELQKVLEYSTWQKFEKAILAVKEEFEFENLGLSANFDLTYRASQSGKNTVKQITDYELSRFFCYKLAMRGETDACKKSRTYFAVQTRKQELAPTPQPTAPKSFSIKELLEQNQNWLFKLSKEVETLKIEVETKDNTISNLTPKADFVDNVLVKGNTGLTAMSIVAKEMGLGSVRLYKILRDEKIWFWALNEHGVNENNVKQDYIDNGSFVVKAFYSERDKRTYDKIFATNKGKLLCYKIVKENTPSFEIKLIENSQK